MSIRKGTSRLQRLSTLRPRLEFLENRSLLSASIYTVNSTGNGTSGSGDSGTLPYVIGLANNDSNPDGSEIQFDPNVFSSPQTITLTQTLTLDETPGPEVIEGPSAALTVSGGGPSSNFSVFTVKDGVTASISGMTIANGTTTGYGGGILNDGTATLNNVTLSGNWARWAGGGIENDGTATLNNVTLYKNSAGSGGYLGFGGGINIDDDCTATLANVTISGNSATEGGGGINLSEHSTATLSNCTIASNDNPTGTTGGGGGVCLDYFSTATLTDCTISGNSGYAGGGIFNQGTVTLTSVTISGNSSYDNGGGIENQGDGEAALFNVTVSGNSTGVFGSGGGIDNTGVLGLVNVTVSGNSCYWSGGGINNFGSGVLLLNNTIVADSSSGGDIYNSGWSVSGDNNLIDASSNGGLTNGVNGNIVDVNPLLGPLGDYGGTTQTVALLPGSPAINAGSSTLAVDGSNDPLATDQRGTGFARTLNGMVDIGAFEDQISGTTPGSQNTTQGVSGSFNLGSFSDQATLATTWSVDVNWGDGSTDTTLTPTSQGSLGTAGHTYNTAGAKTVTVTVSDSYGDVGQYSFSVAVAAPALTSIAVTPASPSLAKGLTHQVTATGTYTDGSTANLTTQVNWASATTSVATISNTAGSQGLASTLAVGTTAITANLSGITSPSDTLTVTAAALTSIAVAPLNPSAAKGLAEQFTATGTYTDGSTANITTQVTWVSATTSVATISNTAGSQGLASTLTAGTTAITAALSGITSPSDTLTVTAAALTSIAVAPANPSVAKGLTEQFTAIGTYADGSTANITDQVTWVSGTTTVASVSTSGLASTLATGTTAITAALSGITSPSDTLTVTAAALTSIAMAPANPSVANGLSEQFTATGTYTDGSTANLTTQVTWASATPSVATISNTAGSQGLASALATGTTAITAALSGITSPSDTLTVTAAALTSIAVAPANPSVAKGLTEQFTATGTYTDGSTANISTQVTWASATTTVATITATGLATGVGTGTSTISATDGSIAGSTLLTVSTSALTATALSASTAAAGQGQSVTYTATVSDLSAGGATPSEGTVTFSDSTGTLASESLVAGVATFTTANLAVGTYTVTASYGGTADVAPSTTGTIVTAAGNGTPGYSGNNGPATDAELYRPEGVAVDAAGDLFIADTLNDVIFEVVKATGDIITVAGNGTQGYSGDNGPATAAELSLPFGVAVDTAGNLFIADTYNDVIREVVKATGDIVTVAGDGTFGYSGDNGPATAAELDYPAGVAVDATGDLFIADKYDNAIREVVKATGDIITVAGNGTYGYSGDNGPATAAELAQPVGVAVDATGDLFIAELGNNVIREVVKATGNIITVAGNGTYGYSGDNGPATAAELDYPNGVAVDSAGDLFIADMDNSVIREVVKATGNIITVAGNGTLGYDGDSGPATAAELDNPAGVAIDPAGNLFIADSDNSVVRQTTPAVTVTINHIITTTSVDSSLNPSPYGRSVQFTATVSDSSGGVPTGSVEFFAGATDLGAGAPLSGSGTSATSTFSIATLPAGTTSISAVYTPTGVFAGSTGTLSQTVNQALLTVSGITAADKVYNASATATLDTSGATLVGVFSGDTVNLNTGGTTGTFASDNVGTGIMVTVAGLTISGAQAGDYTLSQPTTTATITPADLTVSGMTAANKVYNATTTATLNTSGATLVGVFSGDSVNLNTGGATGTFASQNVGTGITVAVAGLTISGAQASDYTLTQPTTTADITPAKPTVSVSDPGGTYSGFAFNATATVTVVSGQAASELEGIAPTSVYYAGSTATGTPLSGAPIDAGAYTVVASFPGSTDYRASTSAPSTFTIAKATPQITWNPPASIAYGTPLGSGQLDASANISGTFTYSPSAGTILAAGDQSLSAVFTPDDEIDYATATGSTTIDVAKATPTTSASDPGGTYNGTGFGATATVTGSSGEGAASLEGVAPTLVYYAGSTVTGAPLSGVPIDAGTYTVLANFPGSADYVASTSQAVAFTISQATPKVSVIDSSGTYNGSAFDANAVVAGVSGQAAATLEGVAPAPEYYAGSTATGTPLSGTPVDAGTYTVVAIFPGSADYAANTSQPVSFVIAPATPTVSVADSGGTYDGSAFDATPTVTGLGGLPASSLEGAAPTVTYYAGISAEGTPLSSAPINAGTYTVVAAFPGSADYSAAQSAPVTFMIGQASAKIALASSRGSAVYGQPVVFEAAVAALVPAAGVPTGTVTFLDGAAPLATVPINSSGKASLTTSFLAVGSHSITAVYNGAADFLGVKSGSASESVAQAGTEVVLLTQPVFRKKRLVSVNLTAEIEPLAPGGGVPTGAVAFELFTKKGKKIQMQTLGNVPVKNGRARLTVNASSVLNKTITIFYGGATDFDASTATSLKLTQKGLN